MQSRNVASCCSKQTLTVSDKTEESRTNFQMFEKNNNNNMDVTQTFVASHCREYHAKKLLNIYRVLYRYVSI